MFGVSTQFGVACKHLLKRCVSINITKRGNMKKLILIVLSGFFLAACQQKSEQTNQGDLDEMGQSVINQEDDSTGFVSQAAMGNLMEIRSGQLAQRSNNPEVKQFATMLMQEHEQAHQELTEIAERKKIFVPTTYPPARQSMLMRLDSLKGLQRDYQYVELMVSEHEIAVPLFKKAAAQKEDLELAKFAQSKLPSLEQHLAEAKKLQIKLAKRSNNETGSGR